ncbi:zinc ribbon domain-containing protein [Natranaerobius trueperi]|uniref:C4-type zinc ribbon domain-containing protein n=1 Tax=Natranaerobius trueperi TaxID=759412 RepID=A0A226BW00_9FIRM|nr:hypothetical protein [Natranaerobius trueperi]OWZ83081.1 hypothetical protein CDO51_10655 [Natranaerobius trueperi]
MAENEMLYNLFCYDRKIMDLKKELEKSDDVERLENLRDQAKTLEQNLFEAKKQLKSLQNQEKKEELENEKLNQEKQQLEKEMYLGDKGVKEISDLYDRINELKNKEQKVFDNYCDISDKIEHEKVTVENYESKYQSYLEDILSLKQEIERRKKYNNSEIEKLEQEKEKINNNLSKDMLNKYNQLMKRFPYDPVVKFDQQKETCACGLDLSTERHNNLIIEGIDFCDSCNRILVYLD